MPFALNFYFKWRVNYLDKYQYFVISKKLKKILIKLEKICLTILSNISDQNLIKKRQQDKKFQGLLTAIKNGTMV